MNPVNSINAFLKTNRLANSEDFKAVFDSGKKLKTRYFALHVSPNNLEYSRLGLVVAKKALKLAVQRNKIKRLIRESFRYNQQDFPGYDVVIVVFNTINTVDNKTLRAYLDQQWKKSVLLWESA